MSRSVYFARLSSIFRNATTALGRGHSHFCKCIYAVSPLDIAFAHTKCLAIKVSLGNFILVVFAFYHPPSNSVSRFILELGDMLQLWGSTDQICLLGDLNINILCSSNVAVSDCLSVLSAHGLECTIHAPTREELVNNQMVKPCLDHVAVRAPNSSLSSCVITQRLANHYFVACRFSTASSLFASRP
ncbi:unnamed protein product [Ixodes persulcatus]